MKSKALNNKIRELCDSDDYVVKGIETSGKCVPYIGWFWREVDFDSPIYLGIIPDIDVQELGGARGGFVGFMENNKWGYESFKCSDNQTREIKRLLELAVKNPSNETLQVASDYIQSLNPHKENYREA